MADGTISIIEGLGSKALDSNEMRRKQRNSESAPIFSSRITSTPTRSSTFNPTLTSFDLCPGALTPMDSITKPSPSSDFTLGLTLGKAVHAPSSDGFGTVGPKTTKSTSPSRKLQQVFEEALVREAEERAANLQQNTSQTNRLNGKLLPHYSCCCNLLPHCCMVAAICCVVFYSCFLLLFSICCSAIAAAAVSPAWLLGCLAPAVCCCLYHCLLPLLLGVQYVLAAVQLWLLCCSLSLVQATAISASLFLSV